MNGRWWIAGVALVGLVLAVLLMPRPDTGEGVPDADPTNLDPGNFKDGKQLPPGTFVNPRGNGPAVIPPDGPRKGPNPAMADFIEQRNRPEVVYSGKILAPWSAIRYVLMKEGSPEARALADEIGTGVMADLRAVRHGDDPRAQMDQTEPKLAAAAAKVEASPWAGDETITKSLTRYRGLVDEYHQALASGGVPTEGTAGTEQQNDLPPEGEAPAPATAPTENP